MTDLVIIGISLQSTSRYDNGRRYARMFLCMFLCLYPSVYSTYVLYVCYCVLLQPGTAFLLQLQFYHRLVYVFVR